LEDIIVKKRFTLFDYINHLILLLLALAALLPFLNVLAKSLSSARAASSGKVFLLPKDIQFETYRYILFESPFMRSFCISAIVTVTGTFLAMLITITTAYPLSRQGFKGRKLFILMYIFSMVFYGGIIPSYLLVKALGLLNTIPSMIIPFLVIQFNMLVVKSYFEQLPVSVEESAKIDGIGNFRILFDIIIPMSKPVIATVSLFYAVAYWNNYFHPMLFIDNPSLKPLQLFLYETIKSPETILEQFTSKKLENISIEGITSTTIICATIPILLMYPLAQKYLISGMTLGAVKG